MFEVNFVETIWHVNVKSKQHDIHEHYTFKKISCLWLWHRPSTILFFVKRINTNVGSVQSMKHGKDYHHVYIEIKTYQYLYVAEIREAKNVFSNPFLIKIFNFSSKIIEILNF